MTLLYFQISRDKVRKDKKLTFDCCNNLDEKGDGNKKPFAGFQKIFTDKMSTMLKSTAMGPTMLTL